MTTEDRERAWEREYERKAHRDRTVTDGEREDTQVRIANALERIADALEDICNREVVT